MSNYRLALKLVGDWIDSPNDILDLIEDITHALDDAGAHGFLNGRQERLDKHLSSPDPKQCPRCESVPQCYCAQESTQ